ncbi:MAG: hypothetical protein ACLRVU_09880 [Beduini sp.]|uniref:hypothetical protein n=1 Tax=Beduini sp. TaxID=1922300 RepID=UPI0039A2C00B
MGNTLKKKSCHIILETTLGHLIIDSKEENLKHLLGIDKSYNIIYTRMSAKNFYDHLFKSTVSIFELVDKKRYETSSLTKDELYIYGRNAAFVSIFKSLFNETNIMVYKKQIGTLLDTDYLQFCYINSAGGYLGIVGGTTDDYYHFNSVVLERDNPNKYIGQKVVIKSIEKVLKSEFKRENYNIYASKRYKKLSAKQIKKANYKQLVKDINLLLIDDLILGLGRYGKNSIQVYRSKTLIEKRLNIPDEIETVANIATYINEQYKNQNT